MRKWVWMDILMRRFVAYCNTVLQYEIESNEVHLVWRIKR